MFNLLDDQHQKTKYCKQEVPNQMRGKRRPNASAPVKDERKKQASHKQGRQQPNLKGVIERKEDAIHNPSPFPVVRELGKHPRTEIEFFCQNVQEQCYPDQRQQPITSLQGKNGRNG